MSGSEAPARLRLRSPLSSLELAVTDSSFREVARGVGSLEVSLPAGIYELRFQAGPQLEKRLVSLEPGQEYADDAVYVAFPSPAPVEGTSTSHEYQQAAAANASQTPTAAGLGNAGLVLMVRNLRELDHPFDRSTVDALELRTSRLDALSDFASGWQLDSAMGWATWSARLPPGGYALRVRRPAASGGEELVAFDQALWLSAGWQTLVFVPNSAHGPVPEWASVHMVELGLDWSPYEREVGLALELALWGLREGRGIVPPDLLQLLLGSKFRNPMLGIIGTHSLLLRPDPDLELCDTVLENLEGLVPNHPDVAALRWLAAETRSPARVPDRAQAPPRTTIAWPPLLVASYAALIRRDAADAGTIEDGSVAERAAGDLVATGLWTAWRPLAARPALRARAMDGGERLPAEPEEVRRATIADPATERVAHYLADVAEVREATVPDVLDEVEAAQIGVAVGLPSASVERALTAIREGSEEPRLF
jgi:hypothetical protein